MRIYDLREDANARKVTLFFAHLRQTEVDGEELRHDVLVAEEFLGAAVGESIGVGADAVVGFKDNAGRVVEAFFFHVRDEVREVDAVVRWRHGMVVFNNEAALVVLLE